MRTLCVIAMWGAALVLIGVMPVGLEAAYDTGGFSVCLRVAGTAVPRGRKADLPVPGQEYIPKTLPKWPVMRILVKNGYTTLCRVTRRVRVETLTVRFTAAWPDPAGAAMLYAGTGVALEALSAACPEADLRAEADFTADWPRLLLHAGASLRLYQLCGAAAAFGLGVARDIIRQKKGKGK